MGRTGRAAAAGQGAAAGAGKRYPSKDAVSTGECAVCAPASAASFPANGSRAAAGLRLGVLVAVGGVTGGPGTVLHVSGPAALAAGGDGIGLCGGDISGPAGDLYSARHQRQTGAA